MVTSCTGKSRIVYGLKVVHIFGAKKWKDLTNKKEYHFYFVVVILSCISQISYF